MAELYDNPPSYSQAEREDAVATAAAIADVTSQSVAGIVEHRAGHSGREHSRNLYTTTSIDGQQNTADGHIIGKHSASNSFGGFIDVLHENKKLPWSCRKNLVYKVGLLVYYFVNFIYSIVATVIQKEKFAFYLIYMSISFTGFLFKFVVATIHLKQQCSKSRGTEEETGLLNNPNRDTRMNHLQGNEGMAAGRVQTYTHKAKRVFVDYVLSSVGEILLHPTLICTLYGFINERGWQLDNTISGCHSLFFLFSVIMEGIYMKFYVKFLVLRTARAAYIKYDILSPSAGMEWKRFFSPVSLTTVLAIMTALTHWIMIAIIGVRIYVDNFTPDKDNTNSTIPDTGDYKVTPLTGYMIACTIYLPIVSWITYIILNKLWFYEVYSAINQLSNGADHMPARRSWNKKILASLKDPLAYIVIVLLMLPFVAFTAGTYLLDYYVGDYEVASDARNAIQKLGLCFIASFVLTNLQAVVIFMAIVVTIIATILCGLPALCVIVCYKKHRR